MCRLAACVCVSTMTPNSRLLSKRCVVQGMCFQWMSVCPMPDQPRPRPWLQRILPSSLLGRLSIVMVAGVMLTQFVGNAFWAAQMRKESQIEVTESSQHLAQSAASTIRFFMSPPPNFRPLIIQQFREMGGTRFYVNLNSTPIKIKDIPEEALTALAKEKFGAALKRYYLTFLKRRSTSLGLPTWYYRKMARVLAMSLIVGCSI